MKKIVIFLLSLFMVGCQAGSNTHKSTVSTPSDNARSGQFSNGFDWKYEDNTIFVLGTGAFDSEKYDDRGIMKRELPVDDHNKKEEVDKVVIGEGITKIDYIIQYLYNSKNKLKIELPSTLEEIGFDTFSNLEQKFEEISIPSSVKTIGKMAFVMNPQESFTLPTSLETIEEAAFYYSKIKEVTMPDSTKKIDNSAFQSCQSLEKVTLNEGLEEVGAIAFYDTALKEITIPKSVTKIGKRAFGYYDKITNGDGKTTKVEDFVVHCYKDSAGYKYAVDNGLKYDILDGEVKESLPTSIKLNKEEMTIYNNKNFELEATIDEDATNKSVTWESSDDNVVFWSESTNNFQTKHAGTAIITATTVNGLKATCKVTVKSKLIYVRIKNGEVKNAERVMDMKVGESEQLNLKFIPKDTTDDKTCTYKSSDSSVVSVDQNGKIKALKKGKATITVTATVNKNRDTIKITVK